MEVTESMPSNPIQHSNTVSIIRGAWITFTAQYINTPKQMNHPTTPQSLLDDTPEWDVNTCFKNVMNFIIVLI